MLRKTRPALSVTAMVLATAGNIAFADKKLYPATFCEPNHGGAIACLDYSRHGFVVNRCQQAIDVVCPLARDKVGSEERFIEITVS